MQAHEHDQACIYAWPHVSKFVGSSQVVDILAPEALVA